MSTSVSVSPPSVGVWLIGAHGSVATTVVAGCAAVTAGLRTPTGMVTETPLLADSGLPPLASLVFGGHDTADCPLPKRAEALAAGGVLPQASPHRSLPHRSLPQRPFPHRTTGRTAPPGSTS